MWKKRRSKTGLIVGIVVGVLLCAIAGAAVYGYFCWQVPYLEAENTMPRDGAMTLWEQEDGSLLLQWPEGQNAQTYTLEVLTAQGDILYTYTTAGCSCVLPTSLPRETEVTLRIRSAAAWRDQFRPGENALEVKTLLAPPKVNDLVWLVDPDTDRVDIHFESRSDTGYHMYVAADGEPELVQSLTEGKTELAFGEEGDYPVPDFDSTYTILFDAVREAPGLTFYGNISASMELCREDFLGNGLTLRNNDLGNNAWQLFWNETKGEHYEVQQWMGDDWQTVATVEREAERTYHTGHLAKFKQFSFRVIAVGGQAEDICSQPLNVTTGAAAVYCTVWPQRTLDIYADETRTQVLGQADAAKAYCVLEEKEGLFGIRFGDGIGYIDSNYCMINLPEYLEDLCAYEIPNSHHAIYMVHGYEIPKVTDTVIKGYENVQLYDGTYLVPLLYPAAKKLVVAANTARQMGYTLKIYDSYRPYKATRDIYELAEKIISDPVPEWTFQEKKDRLAAGLPVTPAEKPTEPAGDETTETGQQPTEKTLTYQNLMTDNGRYYLGNFLAPVYSTHNLGVAMDLTLMDANGYELQMQSQIHDLSWYSEVGRNNRAAKTLQQLMVDAGFTTLASEWWHFQDADARAALDLTPLEDGIGAECWMADDTGWRYRCSDGSYYKNCRKIIDGVTCHFDENGYLEQD